MFEFKTGSSARGIDFPDESINTDIKVTSIRQPQSSCPFKDASQKIFGLGYNLLLFVYDKKDNHERSTAILKILDCTFLDKTRTADYTTTYRLREMIKDGANKDDVMAYLNDRNVPADEINMNNLAKRIMKDLPNQGYLTVSNALQWRLQYARVVNLDRNISGITKIIKALCRNVWVNYY